MSGVVVTGATSLVARYLVPRLAAQALSPIWLISRSRPAQELLDTGAGWLPGDLRQPGFSRGLSGQPDTWIHLAPLQLIAPAFEALYEAGIRRVVAVGTTSRFTKGDSGSAKEQAMVRMQAQTEEWIATHAGQAGVGWTLLRPTLVFDARHDKNIASIVRFVRRWGFFPVCGLAAGLRQPLYAADLAEACQRVLREPATLGRAYNLGGAEVLSYRHMVERVFEWLGRAPRIVPMPLWMVRSGLGLLSFAPRYRFVTPDMADRMGRDMVFDVSDAARDFGFSPRGYSETLASLKQEAGR